MNCSQLHSFRQCMIFCRFGAWIGHKTKQKQKSALAAEVIRAVLMNAIIPVSWFWRGVAKRSHY